MSLKDYTFDGSRKLELEKLPTNSKKDKVDKEALEALNMKVEPEYFYTEKEIRDLLLNKSMDEFLDKLPTACFFL